MSSPLSWEKLAMFPAGITGESSPTLYRLLTLLLAGVGAGGRHAGAGGEVEQRVRGAGELCEQHLARHTLHCRYEDMRAAPSWWRWSRSCPGRCTPRSDCRTLHSSTRACISKPVIIKYA